MAKKQTTQEFLLDIFRDLRKRPDFPLEGIAKKVAFISTPRSGSTMFCDVLYRTGKCGHPMEWINTRYISAYAQLFQTQDIDITRYLEFVMRKTTSENGVFALNFHVEQHQEMLKHKVNIFDLGFDHCYYVYREQKLDQAYSLARASLTDQWTADTSGSRKIEGKIGRARILKALVHVAASEEFYEQQLRSRVTGEFAYEDFRDLGKTTAYASIFKDLGLNPESVAVSTDMKRQQRGQASEELAALKAYLDPAMAG